VRLIANAVAETIAAAKEKQFALEGSPGQVVKALFTDLKDGAWSRAVARRIQLR
jgi:hypothetical protein